MVMVEPMYLVTSSRSRGIRPSRYFQKWSFTGNQCFSYLSTTDAAKPNQTFRTAFCTEHDEYTTTARSRTNESMTMHDDAGVRLLSNVLQKSGGRKEVNLVVDH